MAGTYHIMCDQGSTWSLTLTYKTAAGALVDLTGHTARMQVRTHHAATSTLLSLTDTSGITLGGAAGTLVLTASATATGALPVGSHVYDLELVNGSTVTRLIEGPFTVTPQVTR